MVGMLRNGEHRYRILAVSEKCSYLHASPVWNLDYGDRIDHGHDEGIRPVFHAEPMTLHSHPSQRLSDVNRERHSDYKTESAMQIDLSLLPADIR